MQRRYFAIAFAFVFALCARVSARAQFQSEFNGSALSAPWSFHVPGNSPADTEDPVHYDVSNGLLTLTTQSGKDLYQNYNYAANIPNVTVASGVPAGWSMETQVAANFDGAPAYPYASLIVFADADNYLVLALKHTSYLGDNRDYIDVEGEFNGTYHYDIIPDYSSFQPVNSGFTTLRIVRDAATGHINLSSVGSDNVTRPLVSLVPGDTRSGGGPAPVSYATLYSFLNSMAGKHIGFYVNSSGLAAPYNAAFNYLHTTLPINRPLSVQPRAFLDDFSGTSLSSPWSFILVGNTPPNTEDPANYSVNNGLFTVHFTDGGLYGNDGGSALNVPTVTVNAPPDNWYIATRLQASFDGADGYPVAGLLVFQDVDDLFLLVMKHTVYQGANNNIITAIFVKDGVYYDNALPDYTDSVPPDNADFTKLVIARNPLTGDVTLSHTDPDGTVHAYATLTSADTGMAGDVYAFLNALAGKQVGVITMKNGSASDLTAGFDYFRTNALTTIPALLVTPVKIVF